MPDAKVYATHYAGQFDGRYLCGRVADRSGIQVVQEAATCGVCCRSRAAGREGSQTWQPGRAEPVPVMNTAETTEDAWIASACARAAIARTGETTMTDPSVPPGTCPSCGSQCHREEADVGIGIMHGPWGCPECGWSESPEYDQLDGLTYSEGGYRTDQYGWLYPTERRDAAKEPDHA